MDILDLKEFTIQPRQHRQKSDLTLTCMTTRLGTEQLKLKQLGPRGSKIQITFFFKVKITQKPMI